MLKYNIENAKETLNYIYVHVIKAEGGSTTPERGITTQKI
jgi:hypothetical protein